MKQIIVVCMLVISCFSAKSQYRRHEMGMVYTTYPPYYSCRFCHKEWSPYQYKEGATLEEIDSIYNKLGEDGADNFFWAMTAGKDTTCISHQIALDHSSDVWHKWLKTHKPGKYYLDKNSAMSTQGFIYQYNDKGEFTMGYGGRYDDKYLIADKWYKYQPFNK